MNDSFYLKKTVAGISTLLLILITSCTSTANVDCIDESKISEGPCTMEYRPVCGCDEKTYGNPCQANRSGVTSWEEGACKS